MRERHHLIARIVLAVVTTLILATAQAAVVLNQEHDFVSGVANSTNGNVSEVEQTFTVGIAGTLEHIDVLMFGLSGIFDPKGDPILKVYNTAGGLPTGAAIASGHGTRGVGATEHGGFRLVRH